MENKRISQIGMTIVYSVLLVTSSYLVFEKFYGSSIFSERVLLWIIWIALIFGGLLILFAFWRKKKGTKQEVKENI